MDLERWAERRDGLLTTDRARQMLSARQVSKRKAAGIWRPVRRGVVAINGSPRTWRQAVRAVLLACAISAVASHITALELLGGEVPRRVLVAIHVTVPPGHAVRIDGVVFHRSALLDDDDVRHRDGIPCTSPAATVIDLSGMLTERELGLVVDDFLRRRLLRLEDLRARVNVLHPAPGRRPARLRAVLAARIPGYDPGESALEARLALLIDAHRIPRPAQQHRVSMGRDRYRLDFAWPEQRIFLEGNGFGAHHLATDLDHGARRQNRLVADGWRPMEITWRMTDREILDTFTAYGLRPVS